MRPYTACGALKINAEIVLDTTVISSTAIEAHGTPKFIAPENSLEPHLPVYGPVKAVEGPSFIIRAADAHRERRAVNSLVSRMYATRGYQVTPLPEEIVSNKKTFFVTEQASVVGTLTVGLDSSEGLLAEDVFRNEVAMLRTEGRRVCEFTKLAMDKVNGSRRLLASLFHVAYIHARRIEGLDNILIEVNPRHVRYYEAMLGFNALGEKRLNPRVNAPAVLLSLDLEHAQTQIAKFGGRPDLASTERSIYPYFFSSNDESGIVDRLQRTADEIAQIDGTSLCRFSDGSAATKLH